MGVVSVYPIEDRLKARARIKQLDKLSERVLSIADGREAPDAAFLAGIAAFVGNDDLQRQHGVLKALQEREEKRHMDRLVDYAPHDLAAFSEALAPHEAPPHHLMYLSQKIMLVESGEVDRMLLSMPPGHAKDLDVATPVMMGDGSWKRLGDITVGDMVMTSKGRPREVTAVHEQGVRPVLKLVTKSGRTVRPHPEHLFLTPTDWIAAGELRPGMMLALPREFERTPTPGETLSKSAERDAFIFAGYMMARAVVTGRVYNRMRRITRDFRCDDPAILSDIKGVAQRLGFAHRQTRESSYERPCVRLTFDMACRDWLTARGLYRQTKEEVRIPDWVFRGSDAEIRAFLGAIVSCDAQFVPQVNKHTKAQRKVMLQVWRNGGLADDLQRLFLRIGVNIEKEATAYSNYNYAPVDLYKLNLKDPFQQAILARRCRMVGSSSRAWSLPLVGVSFHSEIYHNDEIVSIVADGECETRCLTVDEDHSFLAEGLVVHNSTYGSRYLPSWYLGRGEHRKYLQAGHTQDFVEKEFGKKTRDIITTEAYRRIFPGVNIRSDSNAAGNWRLTNGNEYVGKGIGQGISGVRSTFNSVDDPYKDFKDAQSPTVRRTTWEWFANDFMTRLLPHGRALIIMTRWHLDDICGAITQKMKEGEIKDEWIVLNLPLIYDGDEETDELGRKFGDLLWPGFYTQAWVERQKGIVSPIAWECLYQGNPLPADGRILKREYFQYSKVMPMHHVSELAGQRALEANKLGGAVDKTVKSGRFANGPVAPARRAQVAPDSIGDDVSAATLAMLGYKPREVGDPSLLKKGDPKSPEAGTLANDNTGVLHYARTVLSVDSAETESKRSDFSAITVWRLGSDKRHYLCYAFRDRMSFPKLIAEIERIAVDWEADVILMETKGAGNQYIQAVADQGKAPCQVIGVTPGSKEGKTFRMDGVVSFFSSKQVVFPERADWMKDVERELLEFPGSKNDDYADTVSQYLSWSRNNQFAPRGTVKLGGRSRAA